MNRALARNASQRPAANRHRQPNDLRHRPKGQQGLLHHKLQREPERAPPRSPEWLVEPRSGPLGPALVIALRTPSLVNSTHRLHRPTK